MEKRFKKGDSRKKNYRGGKGKKWEGPEHEEKSESLEQSFGERKSAVNPFNDFAWYNKNPDLSVSAGSIPFPYRPGNRVNALMSYTFGAGTTSIRKSNIPGICTFNWIPSLGYSVDPNSPISIAARQIYAKVRSVFSGSIDADAPDFVIYLGALDSIFSYIGALKRIYRLINSYSPNNHFIPEGVMVALGIDSDLYNDLRVNKMQLFGAINQLVGMTERFVCPSVFTMFNRHYWLNDNIYMDSPSMNAQFYAFVQNGFYQFALLPTVNEPSVKAGGLQIVDFPTTTDASNSYVDTLFNFGVSLINALAESDDAYTISGYLMRAYDGADKFRVDRLGIDEKFDALYVPEVLAQIENATAVGGATDSVNVEVTQDPGTNTVWCTPTLTMDLPSNKIVTGFTPMLNVRSDAPVVKDVIEASRLSSYLDIPATPYTDGSTVLEIPIIAGTESRYEHPTRWSFHQH